MKKRWVTGKEKAQKASQNSQMDVMAYKRITGFW